MENVKNNTASWRDSHDWIWRVVILVIVILFVVGFYLLLSWNSFDSGSGGGGSGDSEDEGSWLDNLGKSNDSDNIIPAPPTLPS